MLARTRDPLVRILGFALLYGSAFAFLCLVPGISPGRALAVGVFAAWGVILLRSGPTWWCPECWFEMPRREAHPLGAAQTTRRYG